MKLEFFMAMDPPTITHQEHKVAVRNGRPVIYEPPELLAARQKLTDYLAQHKPESKLTGPLELVVTWLFPSTEHPDGTPRITRPDTDNLNKLLKDCMTHVGFWEDDAQVYQEIIQKFWVQYEPCGIFVRVSTWKPRILKEAEG